MTLIRRIPFTFDDFVLFVRFMPLMLILSVIVAFLKITS